MAVGFLHFSGTHQHLYRSQNNTLTLIDWANLLYSYTIDYL
ncbi:hypothetical protein Llab_1092 [Lactococcus lactis]|nr:hypothetical protein Llab_1092 [Lactococcus lactis]